MKSIPIAAGKAAPTRARFSPTHWSVVLAAREHNSPRAEAALSRLCEIYWYPIYAFLRRKGHGKHSAEDLTQAFFAHVLGREWLRNVGPEKGRFRTFVLRCLTNFAHNQPREVSTVSIDFSNADEWYSVEPVDAVTPERMFELRWAATLLDRATIRLKAEAEASGKLQRFEILMPYLTRETAPATFTEAAVRIGISEEAARQETSRLRKRYRDLIRSEISETVASPQEVDAELAHLLGVLSH